jgi:hypothetical protein
VIVNCAGITSSAEFWRCYLDAAKPDGAQHFGCNLDAFWDALEAGGPGWPSGRDVILRDADALESIDRGALLAGLVRMASELRSSRLIIG